MVRRGSRENFEGGLGREKRWRGGEVRSEKSILWVSFSV